MQIVLVTDASFTSAGYALVIADNPDQEIQSKMATSAFVAFESEIFALRNSESSYTRKTSSDLHGITQSCILFLKKHNQQLSRLVTNHSHVFSRQKQSRHRLGTHAFM